MAYTKQTWADDPQGATPITAARLNTLETQYDEAVNFVNSLDTGFRSMAGLTPPTNVAINYWRIRRWGPFVEVVGSFTNNTGAAQNPLTIPGEFIPVGFRPPIQYLAPISINGGNMSGLSALSNGGATAVYAVASGASVRVYYTYTTGDAFPTTLPGIAA